MNQDIIRIVVDALNNERSRGGVYGASSRHVNFEFDNEEYVIALIKVPDGRHWSEYRDLINER